jgi:hypothetical protein
VHICALPARWAGGVQLLFEILEKHPWADCAAHGLDTQ